MSGSSNDDSAPHIPPPLVRAAPSTVSTGLAPVAPVVHEREGTNEGSKGVQGTAAPGRKAGAAQTRTQRSLSKRASFNNQDEAVENRMAWRHAEITGTGASKSVKSKHRHHSSSTPTTEKIYYNHDHANDATQPNAAFPVRVASFTLGNAAPDCDVHEQALPRSDHVQDQDRKNGSDAEHETYEADWHSIHDWQATSHFGAHYGLTTGRSGKRKGGDYMPPTTATAATANGRQAKIFINDGSTGHDVRRTRIGTDTSLSAVQQHLIELCCVPSIDITWLDEDGDAINVVSQVDWMECLSFFEDRLLRLNVSRHPNTTNTITTNTAASRSTNGIRQPRLRGHTSKEYVRVQALNADSTTPVSSSNAPSQPHSLSAPVPRHRSSRSSHEYVNMSGKRGHTSAHRGRTGGTYTNSSGEANTRTVVAGAAMAGDVSKQAEPLSSGTDTALLHQANLDGRLRMPAASESAELSIEHAKLDASESLSDADSTCAGMPSPRRLLHCFHILSPFCIAIGIATVLIAVFPPTICSCLGLFVYTM